MNGNAPRLDGNFSSAPNRIWDDDAWLPGPHRWTLSHFYRLTFGFRRPSVRVSIRVLARRTGFAVNTVRAITDDLVSAGLIARRPRYRQGSRLADEFRLLLEPLERLEGVPGVEPGDWDDEDGGVSPEIQGVSPETQGVLPEIQGVSNPVGHSKNKNRKTRIEKQTKKGRTSRAAAPASSDHQAVMEIFHKGLVELTPPGVPVYMNGRDGKAVAKMLESMSVEQIRTGARILYSLVKANHKFYAQRGFRSYVLENHYNEIISAGITESKEKSAWRKEQEETGFGGLS